MNMPNAWGFFGVGALMESLLLVPSVTDVRAMWLAVMGGVMISTAAVFFAQAAWAWFAPRMVVPVLAALPRPRRAGEMAKGGVAGGNRARVA